MMLVVDANALFSALVAKGRAVDVFEWNASSCRFELFSPEFLSEEIENELIGIMRKSKLSKDEFELAFRMIHPQIKLVPKEFFMEFLSEAERISPLGDFPYVALAMKLKPIGFDVAIWSNDKGMRKQSAIKVLSTHELLKLIESSEW